MRWFSPARTVGALSLLSASVLRPLVHGIDLDPNSEGSIKDATSKIAKELMSWYYVEEPDGTNRVLGGYPGVLYPPYYWWQAGAMFGTMLDYWRYTGDDQYNDLIREGMIHQFGENLDLMPNNQSKNEGNDDQAFWAFTMMSAAEYNFPAPPDDRPGWLAMTQSVFNQFVRRFQREVEDGNCKGGMRWQIHSWLNGWTYKNTASNGGFFHLGARLAMFTRNETYAKWATTAYEWMDQSPLIDDDGTINDGLDMLTNPPCKDADHTPWTYNYGIMVAGAAYMYNFTNGEEKWRARLERHLEQTKRFFPDHTKNIMSEIVCEARASKPCDEDQKSFKAYLSRWLGVTIQMAPWTHDIIMPMLHKSAVAAAQTCTGGSVKGTGSFACGHKWYVDGFDGIPGVGEQMTALNTISVLNVDRVPPPYTKDTGGKSKGDPTLGTGGTEEYPIVWGPATTGEKAGGAILTILVVAMWVGGGWWLVH